MAEEMIIKLKKKRTSLRSSVTKYLNKIETELSKPEVDVNELEEFLEQLIDKAENLKITDSDLEKYLKPDEFEKDLESIEEYREKYTLWKFRAKKYLNEINQKPFDASAVFSSTHTPETETRNVSSSSSKESASVKLPKLSIPKFYGDSSQWLNFWSSYETAIHNNESLNKIEKFNYLKSYLGGTAANTIDGFSLSPENYDSVINLLEERYGRKDIQVFSHINLLLEIPPLKNSYDVKRFRNLFDKCQTQIRCLEALGVVSDTYGSILCPMLLKLLPQDLVLDFNKSECVDTDYKIKDLMEFLRKELNSRERTMMTTQPKDESRRQELHELRRQEPPPFPPRRQYNAPHREANFEREKNKKERSATASELFSSVSEIKDKQNKMSCVFCSDKSHESCECQFAQGSSLDEKKAILMKKGICFRCLLPSHIFRTCKKRGITCSFCGNAHFFIMCPERNKLKEKMGKPDSKTEVKNESDKIADNVLTNNDRKEEVYLQTLIVCIKENDVINYVRIIIDTGSQRSYASKFIAQKMKLKCVGEETVIHGLFGGIEKSERHKRYLINLSNIDRSFSCEFEVMDQEKICASLPKLKDIRYVNEIRNCGIFASDILMNGHSCLFDKDPNEIHILLGADFAGKLFTGDIKSLSDDLIAVNTHLGWTIMGKTGQREENSANVLISLHVNDSKISDLWRLDTLGILDSGEKMSRKELEDAAKDHFLHNIRIDDEGRYVVSLPWIDDHPPLTSCRNLAERRLKNCVRSLEKAGKLDVYQDIFNDWLTENIIEEIDPSEENEVMEHFLPHHPVYKENATTKVRPVFDGSAKEKNSPSINDCLEKGPNLVELIPSVINRFRLGKFGVVADIKKAFLQIGLEEHDRPFLRFLWWEDGKKEKQKIFQHQRVVFGISASPFLLGATLEHHLNNAPNHLQETAQKLLKSFYVDNCVASVNSEEELFKFITESRMILSSAKFDLRGWEHTPTTSVKENAILNDLKEVPVLGLIWKLKTDSLSIDLKEFSKDEERPVTKRKILSAVHRIFDPIGFTCPVTLGPKKLLQECWKLGVSWDAELPLEITKRYERWKMQLNKLNSLEIPRCLIQNFSDDTDLTLHVFCDASKIAYATCVFLRCQNGETVTSQLIQARSRVAPLKSISIPRLELLACTIGARLAQVTVSDLGLQDIPISYWSDSANALYWIKGTENWATFVFNRVQEIRKITDPNQWRHIAGSLNPADLPSRGCNGEELMRTRWWEGPSWLKLPCEKWPVTESLPDLEVVNAEKRKSVVSVTNTESEKFEYFDRISSFNKIKRIMAWILRFCKNSRIEKNKRISGHLSVDEINQAEKIILKEVQRQSFGDDRNITLQTFTDSDGLLRMKSRITFRKDRETFVTPIVLPSKHPIVAKLILQKHHELCHAGLQIVMSNLRENYWILKSRKTIRQVLRGCIKCKRFTARPLDVITAPLPEDRVREALVFEIVGLDLCGPLYMKNGTKCWIVLFTCAVYRAVHLELVHSLSTESLILALRRFIARRGRPSKIYSDNGTNLIGANNCLKNVNWEKIQEFGVEKKIQWKFNPPSAPWWGGFWERLIGLVKSILRKILGRSCLQYEELYTVLCDVESVINSRPLTYISEETEDLIALTPAMFLQEVKETGVPDFDLIDATKLNKRYVYRQKLLQDLRKRFRSEYLGQLREFSKTCKDSPIEIGDIVLIGDENTKRYKWPLAKVSKLYPGKDGEIRVVEVKTKHGSFLRPVQRLIPLEIQESEMEMHRSRFGRVLRPRKRTDC